MPTVLSPGVTGFADDAVKLALQNSRGISGTHKNAIKAASNNTKANAPTTAEQATAVAAAASLQQMNSEASPNAVDGALEKTGTLLGILGMLPMIGGGALNLLGSGVQKIGGWVKSDSIKSAGAKIQKPGKYVNDTTFSELGKHTGMGESVGKAAQGFANASAKGVEKVSNATGIGGWLSSRAFGGAERQFRNIKAHAVKVDLSKVHADIRSDVATIQRHVGKAENVGQLNPEFAKAVVSVEKKMETLGAKAAKDKALAPLQKMMKR